MKTNLELEYKTLISEDTYQQLKQSLFQHVPTITQKNCYYDSKDLDLQKLGYMARIRYFNNQTNEFTLKVPKQALQVHECSCTNVTSIHDLAITTILKQHNLNKPLIEVTHSITTRQEIHYHGGLLALDKNEFLNHQDYEIEFEILDFASNHQQDWQQFCHQYGISYQQASPKVKRAYDSAKIGI